MKQFDDAIKQCSKCKEIKDIKDFCKDRTRSDGLEARCKNCCKKKHKKYYDKHQLEFCQYSIEYNKTHKEQKSEYYKQYYQKNKQECQEYDKEYRNKNKEQLSIKNKEWRQKCKLENRCIQCGKKHDDIKFVSCLQCRINKRIKSKTEENRIKRNNNEKIRKQNDTQFKLACNLRHRIRIAIKKNYKAGSAVRDLGCSIAEFKIYLENLFLPGMGWHNWGSGENDWQIDHIKPLFMFDLTNREQFLEACHYTNLRPLWKRDNLSRTYEELK